MADSASGLIHCLSRGKAGKLQLVFRKLQQSVWLTIVSLEGKGRPVLHAHELLRLHVPLTFVSRLLFADGITTAGLMMWKWLACWQQRQISFSLVLSLSRTVTGCPRSAIFLHLPSLAVLRRPLDYRSTQSKQQGRVSRVKCRQIHACDRCISAADSLSRHIGCHTFPQRKGERE